MKLFHTGHANIFHIFYISTYIVDVCSKRRLFKMGTASECQSIHHTAFLDNNELNFPPRLFHSNKEMCQRIPGRTLKVLLIPTEYAQL